MLIELDEGYSFGLGLFETILLYKGKPVFLDGHLARINKSIVDLELNICLLYTSDAADEL